MNSVLVTGGAGFIGANFIDFLLKQDLSIKVINLDLLTYAGDIGNTSSFSENERYTFIEGDIRDREQVEKIFSDHDIDAVIHFAAESHVDNSIAGPETFITTNVNGTFTLLDVARNSWMDGPFKVKPGKEKNRFLHISTDEVYGSLGAEGLFTEETPYAPNSPYSASKAASDFIVRSYHHTYGMDVVTTNCSNNYGPLQHDEKLIPTIIRNAIKGNNIPIYGDGKNVRDWLYVSDHCSGIWTAFNKGKSGETYNIGGLNERTNIYIAEKICGLLDAMLPREDGKSYKDQISFVKDRPGHDRRYAIDATKITTELGWKADENFESGIEKTVKYYISKYA